MAEKKAKKAMTREARENQMIALADDLAEKKLRDGSASNQLIIHYLNLGTAKAQLEKAKLEAETKLIEAKVEVTETEKRGAEAYEQALKAFSRYRGDSDDDESDDDDY